MPSNAQSAALMPRNPKTGDPIIYRPSPKTHKQKMTQKVYTTPNHLIAPHGHHQARPSFFLAPLLHLPLILFPPPSTYPVPSSLCSRRLIIPHAHAHARKYMLQKRLTLYRLYRRPCYKKVLTGVGSACTCFDKLLTLLLGVPLPVPGTLNVAAPSLGVALPSRLLLIESVALISLIARNVPLLLISLLSILRAFQPSSSRSSLNAFSFSSRSSRSARLAWSWFVLSEDCSSSIVARRLPMRSRDLAMSSASWAFTFSRRSI